MAKFDFDKPVASFSWYLQNGSTDDKRGNRLHVGTGQNAQIYFDPKSGEFIGNSNMSTTISTPRTAQSSISSCRRTAREYKNRATKLKFPISNVKFDR